MHLDPDALQKALSLLASTLSIASSVTKFVERGQTPKEALVEVRKVPKDKNIEGDFPEDELAILNDAKMDLSIIAMSYIPKPILKSLEKLARNGVKLHAKALGQAKTLTEIDRANEEAREWICKILRDAKRFNNGSLPEPYLEPLWTVYGCRE